MGWQFAVDQWWTRMLGLPPAAIQSGGLFAVDHIDHIGVLEIPGRQPLIYAPSDVVVLLEGEPLRHGVSIVQATVDVLADRVTGVLGPTWYGYTTEHDVADADTDPEVHALNAADLDALAALHQQTARDEVHESGTDGLPAFGVFDGNRLIAVACLKFWHQMPTIAALTHPAHRGRGLAKKVVVAATRAGLHQRSEVQYRAFHENRASIAVARACGFSHYGDSTILRYDKT